MFNWLLAWAKRYRRKSRVFPVRLRRIRPDRSAAEYIHSAYYRIRNDKLKHFMAEHPSSAEERQYSRYRGMRRFRSWFVEDVFAAAIRLVDENWKIIHEITGKGRWRQLAEMVWLSVYVPSMPENYYKFEWYQPSKRKMATEYLHRYEMKNMLYSAIRASNEGNRYSFSNKRQFYMHAQKAGVPIPPMIAHVSQSRVDIFPPYDTRDVDFDLFMKPVSGKGGKGAVRFEWGGPDKPGFTSSAGKHFDTLEEALTKYQKKGVRRRESYLVQPRVRTHSVLSDLTGEVASTCRIVVILNEKGEPEPVFASFRMPGDLHGVVDNAHDGGISSPVDLASGELGPGSYLGVAGDMSRHSTRKDNGARIEGRKLPLWPETLSVVRKAHEAFSPTVLVGWDVCITDQGPIIVEGNAQPCTDVVQRRYGRPLSHDRFGELLVYHVRRAFD